MLSVTNELTGLRLHLVHLRSWRAGLHVHHRRLLVMSLLRSLVAHHWCTWPWTGESVGARTRHVSILRVRRAGSGRIHLHLGITRHAHERPVRRLIRHHLTSHCWPLGIDELAPLCVAHSNMLNVRAHTILWDLNLLGVTWHLLWLCAIHERCHRPWRRLHRGLRVRVLHVLGFIMMLILTKVGLYWRTTWCVLGCWPLWHDLGTLEMRRQLMLMRHWPVGHDMLGCR